MTVDISDTLIPNSDQLDAEDLAASGPRIFTVERVGKGNAEQPVQVYFKEFPRPWRPGRNMRRVLAHCWGKDSAAWADHKVELYCDPDVHFGKEKVGGTRIARLSHINGPINAPIIVGRGKRGTWPVKPLTTAPERDWSTVLDTAASLTDTDALGELWKAEKVGSAPESVKAEFLARVEAVKAAAEPDVPEDNFTEDQP